MNIAPIVALRKERSIPADTFSRALEGATRGASVTSIARDLDVPRSTLRDRFDAHEVIDLPASMRNALASPGGQEFLTRFSIALHVHARSLCACGLRVVSNLLRDAGLAPFLGTSVAAQWEMAEAVDTAIVAYGDAQLAAMAPAVAGKEITLALDENFHEGPCLVGVEPASNFVVTETRAPSRDVDHWKNALSPILATLGVNVVQVTSDSGTAILSLAENIFKAHHSPDLFHILYDFRRSFTPALRAVRRALRRALEKAEQEIAVFARMEARWNAMLPQERGRGRPPGFDARLNEEEMAFNVAMSSLANLESHEKTISQALRTVTQAYHPVCTATGRRTGEASFRALFDTELARIRNVVVEIDLEHGAPEAVSKLERMGEKMVATLARVDATWRARAQAAAADAKEKFVLETMLAPASYLERLAKRTTTLKAHELFKTASELKSRAEEEIGEERCLILALTGAQMADDFQRSSSMVEGRNGQLSLRHHAFHELSSTKRQVLTTLHNFVIARADGTTAAERFSGVKPEPLVTWLCKRIKSTPAGRPRRELRKAS